MIIIRFLLLILLSFSAKAQHEYIDQDFKISLKPYGSYAILSLDLANNVKSYWRNPGEIGLSTKFEFAPSKNLQHAEVLWPIPQISIDNSLSSYIYSNKTDFVIKTTPVSENEGISLDLNFEFSTCKDLCKMHTINLKTELQPSKNISSEVTKALAYIPQKSKNLRIKEILLEEENKNDYLRIIVESNTTLNNLSIFLDLPIDFSFNPLNYRLLNNQDLQEIILPIKRHNKASLEQLYINIINDNGDSAEYSIIKNSEQEHSLLFIIIIATIGGLLLNIMPCVLPILALKTLQLIKLAGQELSELKKNLFIQAFGIILSFVFIAIIASILQALGKFVSLGIHFQEPAYLITMVIVLAIIAISLVDEINLNIPQFLNKFVSKNNIDSLSLFLSGMLATLIALPCVAPFLIIALGFALTTNLFNAILIFIFMGIGMALPYILLALFPKATKIIPKPGSWMISFKKFLGALVFLTCIWFIYILSTELGKNSAIVLFLLIVLIKFVLIDKKIFKKATKLIISLILICLCYFMPYSLYQENTLKDKLIDEVWLDFAPSQIPSLIKKDYIVIVDVTASWCPTCKVNKLLALDNSAVLNFMKNRGVIGMRADISKNTPQEVATLMQEKKHFGIPLNIIYSKRNPKGVIMPVFLFPNTIIKELERNF